MSAEGRGLGSRAALKGERDVETGESLSAPKTVQRLQQALHAKAKEAPGFRFYSLSDKVWRADVLVAAWKSVRRNGGTAGVDGETVADIEAYGEDRWLGELAQDLKEGTYRPEAVRQVLIPKKQRGKFRALGIPCIRDRVAQTAAMVVLSPIFEADLEPEQYAYRPGQGAHDAVRHVHRLLNTGHREVVDADLSDYFGQIPHAELLRSVARRVSDGRMLGWVKAWLEMAVEEDDGRAASAARTGRVENARGHRRGLRPRRCYRNVPITADMGTVWLWEPEPLQALIFKGLDEDQVPIKWRVQVPASIVSNSSCTPLNLPFRRLGGRHLSSVSSLSVGSACRYISVV